MLEKNYIFMEAHLPGLQGESYLRVDMHLAVAEKLIKEMQEQVDARIKDLANDKKAYEVPVITIGVYGEMEPL